MTKRQIISEIRGLKSRPKEYLHSVPGQRGLYVCVRPDGRKPYDYRYTSPITGKRRLCVLDESGAGQFDEAVETLIEYQRLVKDGKDPLIELEKVQRNSEAEYLAGQAADQLNVKAMCEWYVGALYGGYTKAEREVMSPEKLRQVTEAGKRSAPVIERALEKDVYPVIGELRASEATVAQCAKVSRKIAGRGKRSQANRVMSYLTAAYNFAASVDGKVELGQRMERYLSEMPGFGVSFNPAARVERLNEDQQRRANERTLKPSEIRRLWKEIGSDCMSPQLSLALKFLLVTGQRVEEVLEARWSEFTLDREKGTGEWAIPMERRKARAKAKHSEPHIVPLTQLHLDLLRAAKRHSGRSKFVFPAQDGAARTSNSLNQAVRRFCKPQGISKRKPFDLFTPRDCRRSFKTLGSSIGISGEILDRIQGHNQTDLSASHYDRYDKMIEKRLAMTRYVAAVDCLLSNPPTDDAEVLRAYLAPDNVVQMEVA